MQIIKNKFYSLLLLTFLAGSIFWVGVNYANAVGDAYFPQDTTVALDAGNFTIAAGSDADTVTTNGTTITVTISTGQSFTLESASRKLLNNDGGFSTSCSNENKSTINLTVSVTTTVVITPSSTICGSTGSVGGSSGGGGGGGGITTSVATPTPTPTVTASPTPTPATTSVPVSTSKPTPALRGFVSLASVSLKDGDVISAAGSSDPDVYIVNPYGYKRLFLNPAIFGFYGHLGGFSKVKSTTSVTRDVFVTSGLFRNCETNDKKVYGVETTGEDVGNLHWVNTTGEQAVKDDPDFFKKVFCINTKEFSWYPQGAAYTSVNQIPDYSRKNVFSPTPSPAPAIIKQYKVVNTDQLNVRASDSTSSAILGKLPVGQIIGSLGQQGSWHKIKYQTKDGWVHGDYLKAL